MRSVSCKLYLLLFRTRVQAYQHTSVNFFTSPTSLRDRSRKDITYYYCDLGLTICLYIYLNFLSANFL